MRLGSTLVVTALASFVALSEAQAQELPVAVIGVQTENAFQQADALTAALRRAVDTTEGYAPQEGEWSLQMLVLGLECAEPPDAACEEKIAKQIKAERFVWGTIRIEGKEVLGDLHFYQKGQPSQSVPLKFSSNLTDGVDETLIGVARDALGLIGAGTPKGRLRINAGDVNGDVFIGQEKVGTMTKGVADVAVVPGDHVIRVVTTDGREMSANLSMKALEQKTISLAVPGPPAPPLDGKIIVGFSLLGVAAGLAGAGLYGSLEVNSAQDQFDCSDPEDASRGECWSNNYDDNEPDACATENVSGNLENICDRASTGEMLQAVFYPLAGASLAAGIILLGVSDWGGNDETAWTVLPIVGNGIGGLNVGRRF